MNLGDRSVTLSPYAPRGSAIVVRDGPIVMHPIDWAELPHPVRWPIARLEAGLDYLVAEANRKLDSLERNLLPEHDDEGPDA